MKLAYSSLACPSWTVEEAADAVARYGFDGIEWRLADGEPITSGAPAVRVFGGPLPDGVSIGEALAPAAEVLSGIAHYAAAHGIQILVETHDPAWSRSANAVALMAAAGVPSVGILYDVLHPCRMGEMVEQTLSTLGQHVKLVHVKDGHRPPDGSEEWPLCALGEGDVPLDTILATLLIGCAAHHQSVRQARVSFGYSAQGVERSSMEAGSAGPSSRVYWTQRRPCGAAGAMTTAHVMPRARVGAPEGTSAVMTPGAPFRRLILGCALFVALVSAFDLVVLVAHRDAVEAQTAALIGAGAGRRDRDRGAGRHGAAL